MSETPALCLVGPPPTPLLQCALAGFQHHGGERCWERLCLHDRLALVREPKNPHDARAIRVEWKGTVLGYVPRDSNNVVAQLMDRGERMEARIVRLFPSRDPWKRVTLEVLWFPDSGAEVALPAPPPNPPPLKAEALLARSLANRIFGTAPPETAPEWIEDRLGKLALVGIEHPQMLPFLRFVHADKAARSAEDPLAALQQLLDQWRIKPAAWKRLPRWTFGAFEALAPTSLLPSCVAHLANLLLGLDVDAPPPREFARRALVLSIYRAANRDQFLNFERHPAWFMRAVLTGNPSHDEVLRAADWLIETQPAPDANQRKAGWSWVLAQSVAYRRARERRLQAAWTVPVGNMTLGGWWIVPIRTVHELAEAADEMRNCLLDYEEDCRSGSLVVFSIRDALTSDRVACFSVGRAKKSDPWELEEVKGPMNAEVDEEIAETAERVAEHMRQAARASCTSSPSRATSRPGT